MRYDAEGLSVHRVAAARNGHTMLESQLVRLRNGALFCTWTTGHHYEPHVNTCTMCARSYDDGRSWVEERILFQHPYKGVYLPTLYQDGNGDLYAFLCTYCHRQSRDVGRYYQSQVSRADPDALHWSIPRRFGGAAEGLAVKQAFRHNGTLYLAASYFEQTNDKWADPDLDWDKPCIVDGREFTRSEFDSLGYGQRLAVSMFCAEENAEAVRRVGNRLEHPQNAFGFAEPAVVELSDGSFLMFLRTEEPHIYCSRSRDLCRWTPPEIFPGLPSPAKGAKVRMIKDRQGRIYLFLKDGPDRFAPLCCWISDDDLKSFSRKVELCRDDTPCNISYPCVFLDEEAQRLHMSFDNHVSEVYFGTISLHDLLGSARRDGGGCCLFANPGKGDIVGKNNRNAGRHCR